MPGSCFGSMTKCGPGLACQTGSGFPLPVVSLWIKRERGISDDRRRQDQATGSR